MKNIFRSKSYWILSVLASIVFYGVLFNMNSVRTSEVTLLISPKSPEAKISINQIAENARELPLTLNFYNTLLEHNPDLEDPVMKQSVTERKNYWNSLVKTSRLSGSSVMTIAAQGNNNDHLEKIARASAFLLTEEMSKYYNIKTDIGISIIDGPVMKNNQRYSGRVVVGGSAALAFVAVFISFLIADWAGKDSSPRITSAPQLAREKLGRLLEENYKQIEG